MIIIRGVVRVAGSVGAETRITYRSQAGDDYKRLSMPAGTPVNRGQIIKFVSESLGINRSEISIPDHIKLK